MPGKIDLTVVIPVYNSQEIFPELYKRLSDQLLRMELSYEIIAVVDGCIDNSADVIEAFSQKNNSLKLIEFSRNFGHQAAITAGLQSACGEMILTMDDDLEDPPEIIPEFIKKMKEGYDIVYGIRRRRKVSFIRKIAFRLFYRIINKLSGIIMPYDAGDFCLMKRSVVQNLNAMPETNRYLRGMRAWLGFTQTGIEYDRGKRFKGVSGYSLCKYIKLGVDGILSFSYKPLLSISIIGFIIAFFSFLTGFWLISLRLIHKIEHVPGWASLIVSFLFIGGLQLVAIGLVGQYIARIFDEVKRRPQFIIRRKLGFDLER